MLEFFRGWRRKAGCLLLAVACLVAVMWFRSLKASDQISLGRSGHVSSVGGRLMWSRLTSQESTKGRRRDGSVEGRTRTGWQWGAFHFGSLIHQGHILRPDTTYRNTYAVWQIPHWSIILVPSVCSGGLILWKGRREVEPRRGTKT